MTTTPTTAPMGAIELPPLIRYRIDIVKVEHGMVWTAVPDPEGPLCLYSKAQEFARTHEANVRAALAVTSEPVGESLYGVPLYVGSAPVVEPVVSRCEKMRAAGYSPRPAPYSCDECGKVFSSVAFLQAHQCGEVETSPAVSTSGFIQTVRPDPTKLQWDEPLAAATSPDVAKMVEEAKRLVKRFAHVYSFVGDETMPIAQRALFTAIEALGAAATQARAAASEPPEAAGVDRG